MHAKRGQPGCSTTTGGFTLTELLVVVGIMLVLMTVLSAALGRVRSAARSFRCKNNLKTVVFDFTLFADEGTNVNRGESEHLRGHGFRIEDFQESVYGIDEFWDLGAVRRAPLDPARQPLMCPAGPHELYRSAGLPCSDYAVGPAEDVSVGFNMRLHRASVQIGGRWLLYPVTLKSRILEHPFVPLVFDVDGAQATRQRVPPYYAAPRLDDAGLYGSGRFWFPAARHGGEVNIGFVGGHVLSASDPLRNGTWDWRYQPIPDAGARRH